MTNPADPIRNESPPCFRIADLTDRCPHVGPTVFRFLNQRTIAVTRHTHSVFVEAGNALLSGEPFAFETRGIGFAGACATAEQLNGFARELTEDPQPSQPRPIVGRYWTCIKIPEIGAFDGVSFWLSHQDLELSSWARPAAKDMLGLRNPVYVEAIDQCAPEIFRTNSVELPLRSEIDPTLTSPEILDLLVAALAKDPALTRKQWEVVSEFSASAYEAAKAASEAEGVQIETSWRWLPEFKRELVHHRATWVRSL